jgi:hypothetical protein
VLWHITHVPSTELPRGRGPWLGLNGYPELPPEAYDRETDDHL